MAGSDELEQLDALRAQGVLTEAEHELARIRLLTRAGEGMADQPEAANDVDVQQEHQNPDIFENFGPPGPDGGPARGRRVPWLTLLPIVVAVFGISLIVIALVGGGGSSKPTVAVNGIVAITNHGSVFPDDPTVQQGQKFGTGGYNLGKGCHTLSGYQDILSGGNVVISDGTGKVLTTVQLRAGVFDVNADCVFGFGARIPKASSYEVKIGRRDPVPFGQKEIANPQLVLQ